MHIKQIVHFVCIAWNFWIVGFVIILNSLAVKQLKVVKVLYSFCVLLLQRYLAGVETK